MRVARGLEQPATQPEMFTDASGTARPRSRCSTTPASPATTRAARAKGRRRLGHARPLDDADRDGRSRSRLRIVMLDHPSNPGFPTYWHARGYGLFAANPMGEKVFTERQEGAQRRRSSRARRSCSATASSSSSGQATPDAVERLYRAFSGSVILSRSMRVGIIGGGNISETHARAAQAIEGLTVEAVYGANAARRRARGGGRRHRLRRPRRFLEHGLDFVIIGSPSGLPCRSRASPPRAAGCTCSSRSRSTSRPRASTRCIAETAQAGVKLGVCFQDRLHPGHQRHRRRSSTPAGSASRCWPRAG